jgi:hypothetical protein
MDILATQPQSALTMRRVLAIGAAAIIATGASAAMASPLITNGSFSSTTATQVSGGVTYGTNITGSELTGWTIGACAYYCSAAGQNPLFDFQMLQNSYTNGVLYNGSAVIPFYSAGPGALSSTYTNAIAVDAANLDAPLQQTVTNLTVGDTYVLSFYQASTQAVDSHVNGAFTGNWAVSLGGQTVNSATMTNPQNSNTGWVLQTLSFTATSASETLSFLATSPSTGQPPFLLLADVSMSVPEPGSLAMLAAGMGGLLLLRRRLSA